MKQTQTMPYDNHLELISYIITFAERCLLSEKPWFKNTQSPAQHPLRGRLPHYMVTHMGSHLGVEPIPDENQASFTICFYLTQYSELFAVQSYYENKQIVFLNAEVMKFREADLCP